MQLVHALAAGIRGAENGTAFIYNRGGSQLIAYYQGDGGFEAQNQKAAGTTVSLDQYGAAVVYVTQYALVVVKDSNGTTVRTFTCGNYDAALEAISPSFTGTDYATGVSGASKPVTLEAILDAWVTSSGAKDWKVLFEGDEVNIQSILTSLGGYLLSVKDHGAEGDGVTDDTAAINAAATAAADAGKVLFFPSGTYVVTTPALFGGGMDILGCGPAESVIKVNHATELAARFTGTSAQSVKGVGFGALVSHTGGLIGANVTAIVDFESCKFGDSFTVGSTGFGYFQVGNDGVSPRFSFRSCDFTFPDQWAGAFITDGAFTATPSVSLNQCRLTWSGDVASNPLFMNAASVTVLGCTFILTAMASSWSSGILGNATSTIMAVGNRLSDTGGGTVVWVNGAGVTDLYEAANAVGSGITRHSGAIPDNAFQLSSRQQSVGYITQSAATQLNLDTTNGPEGILNNKSVVVQITTTSNFTIAALSVIEGLEFELFLYNNAGGASGTITWGATAFAGMTSVAGTAPPTSIAAVGTIVSIKFRGLTGPDGLRYYPVGGSYAGT